MSQPAHATKSSNDAVHSVSRAAAFPSIGIWIALAIYYAIALLNFRYVPIWDSLENLEEYLFLPRDHFLLDNLLLMHNGHPASGYFWPFWIGEWLFPSRLLPVQIINLLIGSLAIAAFGKIAGLAFQGLAGRWEIALITIAFAVQPVFVAYALNMTPDYGVLAYFLATLWFLYSGRLGWAALTGTFLLFSKEIGVPTYLLLLIFYLSGAIRTYRWKNLWPLAVPLLAFGLFCFYQKFNDRPIFPWMGRFLEHETIWDIYLPNPFKPDFKLACLGPFVFEFQWIFTAGILAGLLYGLISCLTKRDHESGHAFGFHGVHLPFRCFLFLLIGGLYIDSRTVVFTNQRYFLTLYPLVLLSFFAALIQLRIPGRFRAVLLSGCVALLFVCNFRTLDPLSKAIAGTFRFGSHQILSIATIRPDPGELNQDQTVYNLQHMYISYLLDAAFQEIRPTNQTTFVKPDGAWWFMSRLDSKTYCRTESTKPPFIKPTLIAAGVLAGCRDKPDTIFVILLPYLPNEEATAKLEPFYQLKKQHTFNQDGYQLQVLEMVKKPIPKAATSIDRHAAPVGV